MQTTCKSQGKRSLFDGEFIVEKLSAIGNPLKIKQSNRIEMFRTN